MRRTIRITGTLMLAAGTLTIAWAVIVWQWQDPFTALYTHWQQHRLQGSLNRLFTNYQPPHGIQVTQTPAAKAQPDIAAERSVIKREAQAFHHDAQRGQAIGRIVIRRIGLNMILVNGTDHETLKKGPGLDPRTYMPGENRLTYIAGHRTTYLAPFSHIDAIRPGDLVKLEMPYATFVYRATHHRIVKATDLSVLRSPKHALLELQACHPRFFATHRYIVYANLVRVEPRHGAAFTLAAA